MKATLSDKAPVSLIKFMTKVNEKVADLASKEINSLLIVYFSSAAVSGLKASHVKELEAKIASQPNVLTTAYDALLQSGEVQKQNAAAKKKKKGAQAKPKKKSAHIEEDDNEEEYDNEEEEFDEDLLLGDDDDDDEMEEDASAVVKKKR